MLAAALLALGAPAGAIAQSAGDEQYEDPLAGEQTEASPPPASGSQGSTPPPAASQPPAATTPSAQPAPPPAAGSEELPRTGGREALLASLGMVLLAGGVALRRRSAAD